MGRGPSQRWRVADPSHANTPSPPPRPVDKSPGPIFQERGANHKWSGACATWGLRGPSPPSWDCAVAAGAPGSEGHVPRRIPGPGPRRELSSPHHRAATTSPWCPVRPPSSPALTREGRWPRSLDSGGGRSGSRLPTPSNCPARCGRRRPPGVDVPDAQRGLGARRPGASPAASPSPAASGGARRGSPATAPALQR